MYLSAYLPENYRDNLQILRERLYAGSTCNEVKDSYLCSQVLSLFVNQVSSSNYSKELYPYFVSDTGNYIEKKVCLSDENYQKLKDISQITNQSLSCVLRCVIQWSLKRDRSKNEPNAINLLNSIQVTLRDLEIATEELNQYVSKVKTSAKRNTYMMKLLDAYSSAVGYEEYLDICEFYDETGASVMKLRYQQENDCMIINFSSDYVDEAEAYIYDED